MTASQASDTGAAAGGRRRRPGRPPTVPLSEFGKEPPPPPRVLMTPRQIAVSVATTIVTLTVLWFVLIWAGGIGSAKWSGTACLDTRVQC